MSTAFQLQRGAEYPKGIGYLQTLRPPPCFLRELSSFCSDALSAWNVLHLEFKTDSTPKLDWNVTSKRTLLSRADSQSHLKSYHDVAFVGYVHVCIFTPCLCAIRQRSMRTGPLTLCSLLYPQNLTICGSASVEWREDFEDISQIHPLWLPNVFFCFFFLFLIIVCMYFGCAGSSLLHRLFFSCGEQDPLSGCGSWASHCSGFSCCGARLLGHAGSVVMALGL